jgi:putative oxidoreductase
MPYNISASAEMVDTWSPRILGVLRILTGLLFVQHGLSKLFGWPHVAMFDDLQYFSLLGLAGVIELVGGLLLTLGLFTRPAAFIMSGEMAAAYFIWYPPSSYFFPAQNGGDAEILYCFVFFYFFVGGSGAWGLDRVIRPVEPPRGAPSDRGN